MKIVLFKNHINICLRFDIFDYRLKYIKALLHYQRFLLNYISMTYVSYVSNARASSAIIFVFVPYCDE